MAKLNAAQAEITLNRQRELLRGNTTTQAAFDQASTDRDVAVARVHQAQADVAQAKAQVETSSLNLSYTDIAALRQVFVDAQPRGSLLAVDENGVLHGDSFNSIHAGSAAASRR